MQVKGSGPQTPATTGVPSGPGRTGKQSEPADGRPRVTAGSWLPFKLPSMAHLATLAVFGLLGSSRVEAGPVKSAHTLFPGTRLMGLQNFVDDWLNAGGRTVLVGGDLDRSATTSTSCAIFEQAVIGARMWAPTVYAQGQMDEDGVPYVGGCGSWQQKKSLLQTLDAQKAFGFMDEQDPDHTGLAHFTCGPGDVAVGRVDFFLAIGRRTSPPDRPGVTFPWRNDVPTSPLLRPLPPLPGEIFMQAQKCAPTLFLMGDQFWLGPQGAVTQPEEAATHWTGQGYFVCRLDLPDGIRATAVVPPVQGAKDFTDRLMQNCRKPDTAGIDTYRRNYPGRLPEPQPMDSMEPESKRAPEASSAGWFPLLAVVGVGLAGAAYALRQGGGTRNRPPGLQAQAQTQSPTGHLRQRKPREPRQPDDKRLAQGEGLSMPQRQPAGSAQAVHHEAASVLRGVKLRELETVAKSWRAEARASLANGADPCVAAAMMTELIGAWTGSAAPKVLLRTLDALGVKFEDVVAAMTDHISTHPGNATARMELDALLRHENLVRSLSATEEEEEDKEEHEQQPPDSSGSGTNLLPEPDNPAPLPVAPSGATPRREVQARSLDKVMDMADELCWLGRATKKSNGIFIPNGSGTHLHLDRKKGMVVLKRSRFDHPVIFKDGVYQPAKMDGIRTRMTDNKGPVGRFLGFIEGHITADELTRDT